MIFLYCIWRWGIKIVEKQLINFYRREEIVNKVKGSEEFYGVGGKYDGSYYEQRVF